MNKFFEFSVLFKLIFIALKMKNFSLSFIYWGFTVFAIEFNYAI